MPPVPCNVITVKTIAGKSVVLDVTSSSTIAHVKTIIQEKTDIPQDQLLHLIFGGKRLEDHFTLSDYRIPDGSLLHQVLRLRSGPGCLYYVCGGKRVMLLGAFELQNEHDSFTVAGLKSVIEKQEGIPVDQQRLTYADSESGSNRLPYGTVLEDDRTLKFYALRSYSSDQTLRLVDMRAPAREEIIVKTVDGRAIALDVVLSDSIASVKTKIEEKEGIPCDQQRLVFAAKLLADESKLDDLPLNIHGTSTLYLVIRIPVAPSE